jgi:hypothetical protein
LNAWSDQAKAKFQVSQKKEKQNMSAQWFMDVSNKFFTGMNAHTGPIFDQFVEETGGLEGPDIFFVQVAYGFAPEPITPKHFTKRGPYGNPEGTKKQLDESVERGWLEAAGDAQYTSTPKSKKVAKKLFDLAEKTFASFETLPDAELKRIVELLTKVVDKATELAEPAAQWALTWGKKFDRGTSTPLMVQVRRRLIDLGGYREGSHIAAWQPYGVDGQTWETLTYLWRDEAGTAAELAEKLTYRDYDEASYAAVLDDLVSRGWAAQENGKYVISEQGKKVRQEGEDTTDRYFDAPWAVLDEAETQELQGLLKKLAKAVAPPEEEEAQA